MPSTYNKVSGPATTSVQASSDRYPELSRNDFIGLGLQKASEWSYDYCIRALTGDTIYYIRNHIMNPHGPEIIFLNEPYITGAPFAKLVCGEERMHWELSIWEPSGSLPSISSNYTFGIFTEKPLRHQMDKVIDQPVWESKEKRRAETPEKAPVSFSEKAIMDKTESHTINCAGKVAERAFKEELKSASDNLTQKSNPQSPERSGGTFLDRLTQRLSERFSQASRARPITPLEAPPETPRMNPVEDTTHGCLKVNFDAKTNDVDEWSMTLPAENPEMGGLPQTYTWKRRNLYGDYTIRDLFVDSARKSGNRDMHLIHEETGEIVAIFSGDTKNKPCTLGGFYMKRGMSLTLHTATLVSGVGYVEYLRRYPSFL